MLCFVLPALPAWSEAQGARPEAAPADVRAAREAFSAGVAAVSRNPSAFLQESPISGGCRVVITASRADGADSLHTTQTFDAGQGWSAARMSIAQSGGVILFRYGSASGAAAVIHQMRRLPREPEVAGAAIGGDGRATTRLRNGATAAADTLGLVLLVAETSRQSDVVALTGAWAGLVRACGGDIPG